MRKLLYNKFTKLIAMLCVLVSAGILLAEGIGLAEYEKLKRTEENELWQDIVKYDEMSQIMFDEIAPYVDELILAYKEGGMQGLADKVAADEEKWDKVYIIAADTEWIYYQGNNPIHIVEALSNVDEEYRQAVAYSQVEDGFYAFESRAGCAMIVDDDVHGVLLDSHAYADKSVNKDKILSESSKAYLNQIDYKLHITVHSSYEYISELEAKYVSEYYNAVSKLNYESIEERFIDKVPDLVVYSVIILAATLLLIISCGRRPEENKELNYYERGYSELHLGIIGVLVIGLAGIIIAFFQSYNEIPYSVGSLELDLINRGFIAVEIIGIAWLYYEIGIIIKKLINKRFIKDWLTVRIFIRLKKWVKKTTDTITCSIKANYDSSAYAALPELKRAYVNKVAADIFMAIFALIALVFIFVSDNIAFNLYILAWIFVIFYFAKSFMEYAHLRKENKVTEAIDTIYKGDYSRIEIAENEPSDNLRKLANLSNSFEEAVRKQVEAEKLQVELVANVSHDLKTPLTSIISYVDLLKEEDMSDTAKDYVRVLVDKSARLKDIVADVFDLAKSTSGEQVPMEQLDGVVLVNQVLSDMNDRIEESGRDLRVKVQEETAPIRGNGQKLYRVFQNVIDNALKYSMPGTRIYLSAMMSNGEFIVTVKNISEYEIDYTSEEIMSRFTRGDKSRHSEGNGLGLSIAKSFTELCGGSFEVKLDDDVFMVIIRLR